MELVAALTAFATLGLVGSLHCAGMCGPFALSLGWTGARRRAVAARAGCYAAGKALSYAMLATLVAASVEAIAGETEGIGRARSVLAWIAGAAMIAAALHALGIPWLRATGFARSLEAPCGALLGAARAERGALGPWLLGFVNGCLPCGLSWSAIALAAAHGGPALVLGPVVFGAATSPVLISLALGGAAIPASWRARGQRAAAALILVFGIWTVWRGGLPLAADRGATSVPPCCAEAGAR
jgi:sulfite exporter TauE/SafE